MKAIATPGGDVVVAEVRPSVAEVCLFANWGGTERRRRYRAAKTPKIGRNDPCPCGSGEKFKRCCGPRGRR